MGILEYMQVHVDIHKFVKVYKVDIPGYTKIYLGMYVNKGRKDLAKCNIEQNTMELSRNK